MKIFYLFIFSIFLFFPQSHFSQNLVINEIITSNSNVITDDDGSYEDWVEIYNSGSESINLLGYGLSDNSNYFKWVFPEYSIQPNEYLLIWCSNKDRTNPSLPLHTNFAISSGGETITLTQPNGTIVDQIPAIVIPQNHSYGRQTDGSTNFIIFPIPTPGFENLYEEEPISQEVEAPIFSVDSGFYTNNFNLTISHSNPQATLIYTLDGSEPKLDNIGGVTYSYKNSYPEFPQNADGELLQNTFETLFYENDLSITDRSLSPNKVSSISTTYSNIPYLPQTPVFKGTVVRAKAIVNNVESKTVTKNYFVTPQGVNRYTFPIITLNIDEDKYYSYENGLNVAGVRFDTWRDENPDLPTDIFTDANYWNSGSSSEIRVNFGYLENGVEILNHDAGLRNQGNGSRHMRNRSVRLYAKPEYGENYFNRAFFQDYNYNNFKRIILRNSGNDGYKTGFRDGFIQKMAKDLNFETQEFSPVVVFLNSEYNGIYNIRERYDEHYFKRVFGIESNELDFLENQGIVDTGDDTHYNDMMNYLQNNDLSNTDNFNHVETLLDPINYTDYYITNIFVANYDWPSNNNEYWRKKTTFTPNAPYGQDGRWRWVLKDTDFGFNLFDIDDYELNMLEKATEFYEPHDYFNFSTLIMRKLLENQTYKNYFINRFADLLNTSFLSSRLEPMIDEMRQLFLPEINEHIHRWQMIDSFDSWENNVNVMRHFAQVRPAIQRNHIREKFNIDQNITATLDVSDETHGFIKINTIDINPETPGISENPYPWVGIYFKNIPVKIKAIANPGYKFSHWSGNSISPESEITINPNGNINLVAHFIPTNELTEEIPLYFWMLDSNVANDTPLTQINSSFEIPTEGTLSFKSSLEGYPFTSSHANWRKASMERRNSPTEINYIPEANNDIPFSSANMRGIQIKQPFQNNGLENQMIFSFSTEGYENIVFGFTAKDENAADEILVDYSINEGEPVWTSAELNNSTLPLTNEYQLYEIDFSSIDTTNDNPNLKVRLRFDGSNMTVDNGDRVTFNNFSIKGNAYLNIKEEKALQFTIYPNPATDEFYVVHDYNKVDYELYSIDGKVVKKGVLPSFSINIEDIQQGIYLLKLTANNKSLVKKIIKK
jgi:hypothetical protein